MDAPYGAGELGREERVGRDGDPGLTDDPNFTLHDSPAPTPEQLAPAKGIFGAHGLKAVRAEGGA